MKHPVGKNHRVDLGRRNALKFGGLSIAFLWTAGSGTVRAAIDARHQPGDAAAAMADGNPPFAPNAFIRIDADGLVRLVMPNVEMGQGIYTGASMMLAEELDVGLDQIKIEHAPPNEALYSMPLLGGQITGGSTSTRGHWQVLREAGAVARTLLITAAAERWRVEPASLRVVRGVITEPSSGRSLGYGAFAKAAGLLPMPKQVVLKQPKDFTLIGKPLQRVDSADKVTGATQFGIDVKLPGMKIATVMACPTLGGRLSGINDKRTRAIPGVVEVIVLDHAVAVVGEHFWAAKQGLDALDIAWELGDNADLTTAALRAALAEASQSASPSWRAKWARSRLTASWSRRPTSCRCSRTRPWSRSTPPYGSRRPAVRFGWAHRCRRAASRRRRRSPACPRTRSCSTTSTWVGVSADASRPTRSSRRCASRPR